jgi:integrase/recombinase XerD
MHPLIQLYENHLYARHLVPQTVKHRIQHIERFLARLGNPDIRDVTLQQLHDYHESLSRRLTPYGRPASLGYQHSQIHAITNFYAFLKLRGKIVVDPFESFPPLRKPHRLPKGVITNDQVLRWMRQPKLSEPEGYRDRTLMEVLYSCGLRGLEVCRLTSYDIDTKDRTVRIHQGKGKKDRVVPIGKVALDYVEHYLHEVRPVFLGRNKSAVDRLFLSNRGMPLTTNTLRKILLRHRDRAGLPESVTVHSLRHACATEMLRGGASVRHVQEMLGHAHLSTTQIYTRVVPSDLKKVHARTAPSERRKNTGAATFQFDGWRDKNNHRYRP